MTYDEVEAVIARGDLAEMAKTLRAIWGYVEMTKKPRKPRREEPKATWLTPAYEVWKAMVGAPNAGRMGKALAPLLTTYSPDEIGARLRMYLLEHRMRDEMRFASVERFASTINLYNPSELAFEEDA